MLGNFISRKLFASEKNQFQVCNKMIQFHISIFMCVYIYTHTYILFQILLHYRFFQGAEYTSLCCTAGPCCLSFMRYLSADPKFLICPSALFCFDDQSLFPVSVTLSFCFANEFIV